MDQIKFTIPGKPVGKGRPRFYRMGNRVGTYTPDATKSYEATIQQVVRLVYGEKQPINAPLFVTIVEHYEIPQSWGKTKRMRAIAGGNHTHN